MGHELSKLVETQIIEILAAAERQESADWLAFCEALDPDLFRESFGRTIEDLMEDLMDQTGLEWPGHVNCRCTLPPFVDET